MADRHTPQAPQTGSQRAPRAFLRGAVRGVVLPLIATGALAVTVYPAASSSADISLSGTSLPPYEIVSGEELRPDRPVYALPVMGGYRLTARFGQGGGLWSRDHTGLDFAAPTGSTVRAIARGTVVSAGYDGAYGNKIVVRLASGAELWFCHLNEMFVQPGDQVSTGTHLGEVGSTGNTTGPHLHLEVRPGPDTPIDPMEWLTERGLRP